MLFDDKYPTLFRLYKELKEKPHPYITDEDRSNKTSSIDMEYEGSLSFLDIFTCCSTYVRLLAEDGDNE